MTPFKAVNVRCRHRAGRWFLSASVFGFTIVAAIADASVNLVWSPETYPNLAGYKIYYGTASRSYTHVATVGFVTNATVSGLREGFNYFFAAVAYIDGSSESDFSAEVSRFIPVTNPSGTAFGDVSGTYDGLFFNTDPIHQTTGGFFSLFVNGRGVYSGHFQSGGFRASFHGQLDPWCQATNVVAGPNNTSFVLQFHIGNNGPGQLLGQILDGTTLLSLTAERAWPNTRTLPAPFAGRYTLVLPGRVLSAQQNGARVPQGYGFGVAQVTVSGSAMLTGTLVDGTHITQSAAISEGGVWPFYVPLYSGKGSIIGSLMFTNRVNDDLNGEMNWIEPGTPNKGYYFAGFTNQSQMIGSRYHMPSPLTKPILDRPSTFIAFTGGDLGPGFTNAIFIGRSSRVTNQSPNSLVMTFSIPTGTFRGNVADPASGRTMLFGGVVFQKDTAGYGFLQGNDQPSGVLLGY